MICDWIDHNLHAADLSVDQIATRLHLSRSSLYRLFQPWGGVKSYLHECRLRAARIRLKSTPITDKTRFNKGFAQPLCFESSQDAPKSFNCYDEFFAEVASLCRHYYHRQGIPPIQSSPAFITNSHHS